MENLIKLDTLEYPVSTTEFFNRHRQTSFPQNFSRWDEFGYAVVFPAPAPQHDPMTQYVRELAPVLTQLGTYQQAYEILDLGAETIEANQRRTKDQRQAAIIEEIKGLQLLALRALVEDSDTVFLERRQAAIAVLRAEYESLK